MSTLEKLSAEYEETARVAATIVEELPAAVQGGWSTRVREAKDHLKELRNQYKATLLKNGVAIFLEGDAAKIGEFAQLVTDENDGLVVDANALYDRLAQAVEVTISEGGRQWGTSQTHRLHLGLQEVMAELGLSEIPMPAKDALPYVATYADTVAHTKQLVRAACGDNLNRMYIVEQALRKAVEIRYIGVMAPVLVLNAAPVEHAGLAQEFAKGSAVVKVELTDEVNKEFLGKTFREVNKKIRTQKK